MEKITNETSCNKEVAKTINKDSNDQYSNDKA